MMPFNTNKIIANIRKKRLNLALLVIIYCFQFYLVGSKEVHYD